MRASLKEADEKARPRDNLDCEDFEASIAAAQIPDAFRGPKGDEKARPCEDFEVQPSYAHVHNVHCGAFEGGGKHTFAPTN